MGVRRFLASALVGLALALLSVLAAPGGRAEAFEHIRAYDVRVEVEAGGDAVLVTERIAVRAEGGRIRRGIFRDFPTSYVLPTGLVRTTGFEVRRVTRDGRDEPWRTEGIERGTRLYVGDKDVFLSPGDYTYEITYRSARQMRFFADYDEIYWNATGNGWDFLIASASATIRLPAGARVVAADAYTGPTGATARDASVEIVSPTEVRVRTTKALDPREGLTVAVAMPKGFVDEPSAIGRLLRMILDNWGFLALLGAVPLSAFWYVTRWHRVGRDPDRGVVFPRFEAPDGLSPAAVAEVFYRGSPASLGGTSRAFVAALVSLGVKGRVTFQEIGDDLRIAAAGAGGKTRGEPSPVEAKLEAALLGGAASVTLSSSAKNAVLRAQTALAEGLKTEVPSGRYFTHNHAVIGWGLLLTFLAGIGYFAFFPKDVIAVTTGIGTVVGAFVAFGFLMPGIRRLAGDAPGGSTAIGVLLTVVGLVIAVPVVVGGVLGPMGLHAAISEAPQGGITAGLANLAFLALIGLGSVFQWLIFAPTAAGQKLAEAIEGFRLYLSVAEEERLNMAGAPDFTVDLYERLLPYAIALGVEKPWSRALEAHVARAAADQDHDYRPGFWSGRSFSAGNIGSGVAAIGSTIGSSVSAAVPSSSGSGGGGSSGGGGGGGGGGGW